MPKRKTKAVTNKQSIQGLTSEIIRDAAAYSSYERGTDMVEDVIIDSHSAGNIKASISGKGYAIEITFETPVKTEFDIECDCSCPDDRDGYCKHICAVLVTLIDLQPAPKKRKKTNIVANSNNNTGSSDKENSECELKGKLAGLDKQQLIDIIDESLKFVGVQKIVAQALKSVAAKKIDLRDYKTRMYEAVHQLDRLRPSAQFSMSHEVDSDLQEIINEARNYHQVGNDTAAMQILIAMGKSISNENNIEGEVWKSIHSCGGIDGSIASAMSEIIENNQDIQTNKGIYKSIHALHGILSGYGIEDYEEVLQQFDFE